MNCISRLAASCTTCRTCTHHSETVSSTSAIFLPFRRIYEVSVEYSSSVDRNFSQKAGKWSNSGIIRGKGEFPLSESAVSECRLQCRSQQLERWLASLRVSDGKSACFPDQLERDNRPPFRVHPTSNMLSTCLRYGSNLERFLAEFPARSLSQSPLTVSIEINDRSFPG